EPLDRDRPFPVDERRRGALDRMGFRVAGPAGETHVRHRAYTRIPEIKRVGRAPGWGRRL
ncbi:MAG: hypothetical protein AVDCRST_MAG02-3232, partial [uncultured Rubrobacteraceae bacterium]